GQTPAFAVGWLTYVSATLSTAATSAGLSRQVAQGLGLTHPLAHILCAISLVTVIACVCASGIAPSARAWTLVTALKLVPLLALLIAAQIHPNVAPVHSAQTAPSWFRAALLVIFTFQGFEIV